MPVSPDVGNEFAAGPADLLAAYELKLLETGAKALRGDQTLPQWATTAMVRISEWRRAADRGVPGALRELADAVRVALAGAADAGATTALADLPGLPSVAPVGVRGVTLSVDRLTRQLATALQQVPAALELVLRESVRAGAQEVAAGAVTRRQASQQVLDRLTQQGINGFRDSRGRNWSLTSYGEMAVRTEVQRAALEAGEARIREVGLDLVLVSDSPRECPVCRPYEGQVLSLDGNTGTVARTNELTGEPVDVEVFATLEDARLKGFQHPNCTHSFVGFLPGVTKQRPADANPDGYEQKQRQREMERHIRRWKREEVLALDPAAQARAAAKVREWQGALRQYVKDNDLKRQPGRESITRAV